jgi:hypothetical protein
VLVARVASIENTLLVLAGLGVVARPALAGIFVSSSCRRRG